VKQALSKGGYLLEDRPVLERDLERRKQVYLRGYFLPLRRAALAGFSPDLQLKLLEMAWTSLAKMPDPQVRRQWQFQIKKDRSWVQQQQVPSSEPQPQQGQPVSDMEI
jgi:hypothetical protein